MALHVTVIQTAPGSNHTDSRHNKPDRQTNADPSNTTWSTILYIPINWINVKWFYISFSFYYYYFPLTGVLHHERIMMEGKMNCHWHMSSCIAILNIEDICQKTCHVVTDFVIYLSLMILKANLKLEHNFHNEVYGYKILHMNSDT